MLSHYQYQKLWAMSYEVWLAGLLKQHLNTALWSTCCTLDRIIACGGGMTDVTSFQKERISDWNSEYSSPGIWILDPHGHGRGSRIALPCWCFFEYSESDLTYETESRDPSLAFYSIHNWQRNSWKWGLAIAGTRSGGIRYPYSNLFKSACNCKINEPFPVWCFLPFLRNISVET